jgi:hypothetical protein
MIRREIISPEGTKLWLLISQVEHARVSGEIARCWREDFTAEVIEAIAQHDDGWAAWEAQPKLKPETGAPYSFLEMPLPAALVIWDHSIAAAEKLGPLGGFIVAGHFYNLLSKSENASDPLAVAWLAAKRKQRTSWLDQWVRANPSHTLEVARQAQQMLLLADLFSLWLCCDAPAGAGQNSILSQSAMKLQTNNFLKQYHFAVPEFEAKWSEDGQRPERLSWSVAVHPYPFRQAGSAFSAEGLASPVARYAGWAELSATSRRVALDWRLFEGLPATGAEG